MKGIESRLGYLRDLGVTALWIGPIWKRRADLQTYHGYGIQNFLDVDPRFGTRQDLRDLVDAAHALDMYVLLDIIYNHSGNNWFYDVSGTPQTTLSYRFQPPYDVHGWRSRIGESLDRHAALHHPPQDQTVSVGSRDGCSIVRIDLPPAGMVIVA